MLSTNQDVACRELGGRLVLVNLQTGFYYTLNETATFVFQRLQDGKEPPVIVHEMAERFDVAEDTARVDLAECIDTLVEEKLLDESRNEAREESNE